MPGRDCASVAAMAHALIDMTSALTGAWGPAFVIRPRLVRPALG